MDDQRKPRRTFPWFKFYAAEVFARTAELSTHELGAYIRIVCALWQTDECTLARDPRRLRMLARVHPNKWARTWSAIEQASPPRSLLFFQLNFALRNYRGGSEG
jgi:uncharacterized protein DUF1376